MSQTDHELNRTSLACPTCSRFCQRTDRGMEEVESDQGPAAALVERVACVDCGWHLDVALLVGDAGEDCPASLRRSAAGVALERNADAFKDGSRSSWPTGFKLAQGALRKRARRELVTLEEARAAIQ